MLEIISPMLPPERQQIPCITLAHAPPVNLEAVIVDVGDGGPADFEKHQTNITGRFVMVNSKTQPRGTQRWVHRGEK